MNEIMKKTYELIDVLEESEIMINLEKYKEKIMNNEELRSLIHKGNSIQDEYILRDVKKRLYQYEDYQGYMDCYNQLMYLVMDMNYRFQGLIGKGCCHK